MATKKNEAERPDLLKMIRDVSAVTDKVRHMESAISALMVMVNGTTKELAVGKGGMSENVFLCRLYEAVAQSSIRKWTRKHTALARSTAEQIAATDRKLVKMRKIAEGSTPEAETAKLMTKRLAETRAALGERMNLVVRKFLEMREAVLLTLAGTSDMMFCAAGEHVRRSMVKKFDTTRASEAIAIADRRACATSDERRL